MISRSSLSVRWAIGGVAIFIATAFLLLRGQHRSYKSKYEAIVKSMHHTKLFDDVYNSTLGFEKIFVVGLPSRTDRRDNIILQASISNIEVEFIDGVKGADVAENAIPMDEEGIKLKPANIGSWRAHMNAVQEIVRQNLTSALILEDDVDWDIRLKEQLADFALSTRALIQPLRSSGGKTYADPTYPRPPPGAPTAVPDLDLHNLPAVVPPTVSPYGDGWDALWIGNCGLSFPYLDSDEIPKGRVIHGDDVTVPPKKDLWSFNKPFLLVDDYPEHTRAVFHAQEGLCTLGYALSQDGARKLLYEVALKPPTVPYDFLLRYYCDGTYGRRRNNCLGVQPALFHHFLMAGPLNASSDIGTWDGWRNESESDMIRWSVRLNADKLMNGETDFVDQYPDEEVKGEGEGEGKETSDSLFDITES